MKTDKRPKGMKKAVFYALGALLVCALGATLLVGLELAYRYKIHYLPEHNIDFWVPDADLIYAINPEHRDFPYSFRGQSHPVNHNADQLVICLGGSTTFCGEVEAEETWSAVAEQSLLNAGVDVELLNAGVPGYGTRQLLLMYERDIAKLNPDLVLIYTGWNRNGALVDDLGWVPHSIAKPSDGYLRKLSLFMGSQSMLYRRLLTVFVATTHQQTNDFGSFDPRHDIFAVDLKKLVERIQQNGQQVALIVYPALYYEEMGEAERELFEKKLWGGKKFSPEMLAELRQKHDTLRKISRDTGAELIDLHGYFQRFSGEKRAQLFVDELHISLEGNRVIGNYIGEELASRYSIPKTRLAGQF